MGRTGRRLCVFTYGHADALIVKGVLREFLLKAGYSAVDARLLGHVHSSPSCRAERRWPDARAELIDELSSDSEQIVTTMVDYNSLLAARKDLPEKRALARLVVKQLRQRQVGGVVGVVQSVVLPRSSSHLRSTDVS